MLVLFRAYSNEADYNAIRNLIVQKFSDPNRRYYPSLGDLDYNRSFGGDKFLKSLIICEFEDGTIIGAVWPGHHRILYCVTGPDYVEYEDEIFSWAETQFGGPSLEDRNSHTEVYIWGYQEDQRRIKILTDRNYTRHTWYMYSGVIDLNKETTTPVFQEGYTVRPIQSEDLKQKVTIMSGSAGLTEPNMDIYKRLMSSKTYQPDLDLVVTDVKQQVVGFANIWYDSSNNIASIEPFGTAETHRRKGIATNLLYECMHRLRKKGVDKLYINHGGLWTVDPEPDDAMRVYNRVGFQELGRMFVWCKTL